jgi:signal recognition particle GTPase
VARGSGTSEKEVKELLQQYGMMKKMIKTFRRKRALPFLGGKKISMDQLGKLEE